MDKIETYRQLIRRLIKRHTELGRQHPTPGIDTEMVFDDEHGQYLLLQTGWFKRERWSGPTLYLRLRDGKIWVEEDWLEEGITDELLAAGVPAADIVLAFHQPEMRHLTEFAIA